MATNTPSTSPSSEPLLINCVYALSGTYGLLPRLLYYATLAFAIFGRSRQWLVIGALVSALTYAGTAAIHAMALCRSKKLAFDLDIAGTWAVLSTGAISYIVMVHWSTTLRNSRARIVMVMWGVLVGSALIFARASMFDTELSPGEPACFSNDGSRRMLRYPIELLDPQFECTYKCFSAQKPMRTHSEIIAVPRSVVDNHYSRLALVGVGPIMFAAYAAIAWDTREHSPSQFLTRIVMKNFDPRHHEEITKLIYNAAQERWYGGYMALYTYTWRMRWNWRKACIWFVTIPWFTLVLVGDILCIPLLVVSVVLNELNLLGSNLPMNESNRAIGQWGPIVGSMLVVYAACVNRGLEEWDQRKKRRQERREGADERMTVLKADEAEIELGQMDGQSVGVVKPKLAHVQTLMDMDELMKRDDG